MPARSNTPSKDSTANLGFEARLWLAADSRSGAETAEGNLRNNMDAAETGGAKDSGLNYDPACGSGGSLPASRLCRMRFAQKDRAVAQGVAQSEKFLGSHGGKLGDISVYGQDRRSAAETDEVKWARRQRPFGLAKRTRRVRLRRQQPKQSNPTTRRLAIMNLVIRGPEAVFGLEHAETIRRALIEADLPDQISGKCEMN